MGDVGSGGGVMVSILVLVDAALRRDCPSNPSMEYWVSILVLVDAALRPGSNPARAMMGFSFQSLF